MRDRELERVKLRKKKKDKRKTYTHLHQADRESTLSRWIAPCSRKSRQTLPPLIKSAAPFFKVPAVPQHEIHRPMHNLTALSIASAVCLPRPSPSGGRESQWNSRVQRCHRSLATENKIHGCNSMGKMMLMFVQFTLTLLWLGQRMMK